MTKESIRYAHTSEVEFAEVEGKLKIKTKCAAGRQSEYSKLIALLSRLNAETNDFDKNFVKYKSIAISLIIVGIVKNYKEAEIGLEKLLNTISRLKRFRARGRYWLTMTIPFLIIFSFFSYHEWGTDYTTVQLNSYKMALKCVVFGILGGVLSTTFQLHKIDVDIESPRRGVIILAVSRFFLAAASGFASYYLLRSGIFGMITAPENIGGFYAVALIAGFSEHYVPNMLIQIAKKNE